MVKHLSFEEAWVDGALSKGYKRSDLKDFFPYFVITLKSVSKNYLPSWEMESMMKEQFPGLEVFSKHVRVGRNLIARSFILCGWTLYSGSTRSGKKFKRGKLNNEQARQLEEWLGKELPKELVGD
jgi:hypothetical protein